MSNEKMFELMNRDIDGVISPTEQTELRAFLATNEEARAQYNELVRLNSQFKAVNRLDAPAGLKSSIMADIPFRQTNGQGVRHEGFLKKYASWFVPSPSSYVLSGAMAGALVVVLAFAIFRGDSQIGRDQIGGTMAPIKVEANEEIDKQVVRSGDAKAVVTSSVNDNDLVVELAVTAPSGAAILVAYDQQQLTVSGLSSDGPALQALETAHGEVRFVANGSQSVRLTFRSNAAADGTIRVELTQDGMTSGEDLAIRAESVH